MKLKLINKLSSFFILLSAIALGLETSFHDEKNWNYIFRIIDLVIITYFTIEIFLRLKYKKYKFNIFTTSLSTVIGQKNNNSDNDEIIEEWAWLIFDFIILILAYLYFLIHFIEHPQLILLLRLFRIFRIFRLFELSNSLKVIEKKIISTISTIVTFFVLLLFILYSYSIVGMYLYDFKKTTSIDFSSVYSTMTGLFLLMTNDWANTLVDLRKIESVSTIYTDIYLFSFFIFSVIITLNVFLAVMTSQIQDRLKDQITGLRKKEEEIAHEINRIDKETDADIALLNKKLDHIIENLKKS